MRNNHVADTYRTLQQKMCSTLEEADGGARFITDSWKKELGEGATMVLTDGDALEKAAINFSKVSGPVSDSMRKSLKIEAGDNYFATGISSIIHPKNPHVPITHMNVRYFQLDSGMAWFGGGIDLTPHYVNVDEASWFHQQLEELCTEYESDSYQGFKKWADDYFYIPHRQETRGIGGVFFDHQLAQNKLDFKKLFNFTQALADAYPRIYIELMNQNRNKSFSKEELDWQRLRRGRYVEFNLLYDRGTKFGLDSGGRTESIFLSMPPLVSWEYQYKAEEGSREHETLKLLKKDIDWVNMGKRAT